MSLNGGSRFLETRVPNQVDDDVITAGEQVVASASSGLSPGRLALGSAGNGARRTAAGTAALQNYVRCLTRSSSMNTKMPSTAFAMPDMNSCGQLHSMRKPTMPRAIMKYTTSCTT